MCIGWVNVASAQVRPLVPIVAPPVVGPMPQLPTPLAQPLGPHVSPPVLQPHAVPALPQLPTAVVPTRPAPPVVHDNPPIIPYHRNDDVRPAASRSNGKKDDPMWMHRALDPVGKEEPATNVAYERTVHPPPPPAPAPSGKKEDPSGTWNWLILALLIAGVAFGLGRASRDR
jgi:hypothetical protein